jgi:dTDP-4-dehydrorhamnose 3,5-epimerase-like enzyme
MINQSIINGVEIFEHGVLFDNRGWSGEAATELIERTGDFTNFKINRCYISTSRKSVLRGLHVKIGEQKFITCTLGRVIDILFDLRPESTSYLMTNSIELSPLKSVYVPAGVAHGTLTISEDAQLMYFR